MPNIYSLLIGRLFKSLWLGLNSYLCRAGQHLPLTIVPPRTVIPRPHNRSYIQCLGLYKLDLHHSMRFVGNTSIKDCQQLIQIQRKCHSTPHKYIITYNSDKSIDYLVYILVWLASTSLIILNNQNSSTAIWPQLITF